mgnify:CR=1 FL=1
MDGGVKPSILKSLLCRPVQERYDVKFFVDNWMLIAVAFASGALLMWPVVTRGVRAGSLTPSAAVQLINREKAVVVDVSEPEEFAKGHIVGSRNIPLGQLDDQLPDAVKNKALPLVLGGAIGNLVDRVRLGYVVDFIHMHLKLRFHWPTYNVADIVAQGCFLPLNEIEHLRQSRAQLQEALDGDRSINVATGITMMQYRLPRAAAFELLRSAARSPRRCSRRSPPATRSRTRPVRPTAIPSTCGGSLQAIAAFASSHSDWRCPTWDCSRRLNPGTLGRRSPRCIRIMSLAPGRPPNLPSRLRTPTSVAA